MDPEDEKDSAVGIPEAPSLPGVFSTPKGFQTTPKEHFEPVKLHFAINHDNLEEARGEINRGINLDFVVHGNTPLMLALLRDQRGIAKLLIDAGADVTIPEIYEWRRQPIHLAARDGHDVLLQSLLDHGAYIQAADGMLMTPLHWAAAYGHLNSVNVLLENGAHVNVKDDRGRTPLFRAVCGSHTKVVQALIQDGASVNTQDIYGWSPLHHAALCSLPLVTGLLSVGALPNLQDFRGDTPLHLVMSRQSHSNLIILSRTDLQFYTRDLKITSTCTEGIRTFISDRDLLLRFLDYGCDVNVLNFEGKSPLQLAITNHNLVFIRWLVCAGAKITLPVENDVETRPFVLVSNRRLLEFLSEMGTRRVSNLVDITRVAIRKYLRPKISDGIDVLPLPPSLRQFLQINLDVCSA